MSNILRGLDKEGLEIEIDVTGFPPEQVDDIKKYLKSWVEEIEETFKNKKSDRYTHKFIPVKVRKITRTDIYNALLIMAVTAAFIGLAYTIIHATF